MPDYSLQHFKIYSQILKNKINQERLAWAEERKQRNRDREKNERPCLKCKNNFPKWDMWIRHYRGRDKKGREYHNKKFICSKCKRDYKHPRELTKFTGV